MALDVRALSITSLFNSVKSFFKSQENNSRWKDSTSGAEGNFLMRMISNAISVLSQRVVTGRREQFHDTANLVSSNIGLAVNNGYSVFRGTNTKFVCTITPNMSRPYPAFSVIGHYDDENSLIVTQDYTFVKDEPQTIELTVGKLKEIEFKANTNELKKFIRFEQGISEDIQLSLDGVVVPHTKIKKDQYLQDKYYIYTNPWKSITIEYLNNKAGAAHKYSTDTTFLLKYIEHDINLTAKELTYEMFDYADINDIVLVKNPVDFETITEIKIKSPIHREVQNLVRSKADFPDIITENTDNIVKTNFEPLTPTFTAVTYMKDDLSMLEDYEQKQVIESIYPAMAFGRPRPDIVDPICETVTLDITLGLTNRYTEEADVMADVRAIIDSTYSGMFEQKFNIYDLEKLLNKLTYVRYSRVNFSIQEREPHKTFQIGDLIEADGKVYKCTGIVGQSGATEPVWKVPGTTSTEILMTDSEGNYFDTIDKNVTWRCYKRLNSIKNLQMWRSSKGYKIGDWVYSENIPNYMFKCVDIVRTTGDQEPDTSLTEVGDKIIDGTLVLICIGDSMSYYQTRENAKSYPIGSKLNIGYNAFQYVGQVGKTGSSESLEFNDNELPLAVVDWEANEEAGYINREDKGIVYIKDSTGKIANSLNVGDTIRIRAQEPYYVQYTDLDDDQLIASTVLKAKVKEYTDKTNQETEQEEITGSITTNIEYNINMGYKATNNYPVSAHATAETAAEGEVVNPEVNSVILEALEIGDIITDGELELMLIELNEYLSPRIPRYGYAANEEFNIIYPMVSEEGISYNKTKSFRVMPYEIINTSGSSTETTPGSGTPDSKQEVDPNAHWKELEAQLKLQEEVEEWIKSEKSDRLRIPADVLTFFKDVGKITEVEMNKALEYYRQYNDEDEQQIYLCMDQFGVTRLEAVQMLLNPKPSDAIYNKGMKLINIPVATATDIKYYLKENPDKLMYVDRVSHDISESTSEVKYNGCVVKRYDEKGPDYEKIKGSSEYLNLIKTTVYGASGEEVDDVVEVLGDSSTKVIVRTEYSTAYKTTKENTYVTTIRDINSNRALILDGRLSKYTQIFTNCNVGFYEAGSYINPSLKKTYDGDIIWEVVDNLEEMEFDWNVYNEFTPNLTIKY